jgi:hypothetical protein
MLRILGQIPLGDSRRGQSQAEDINCESKAVDSGYTQARTQLESVTAERSPLIKGRSSLLLDLYETRDRRSDMHLLPPHEQSS